MEQDFWIRHAEEKDLDTLTQFNIELAKETEGKELSLKSISSGIQAILKNAEYGFYLVLEKNRKVVGCLMITTEWSDWRNGFFWWIQSVYVPPDFRRQGIFKALYQRIQTMAKDHPNVCGLRLYVDRENHKAQETYHRMGMEETNYVSYEEEFRR
ncbi:MAG: GNAT family N-acetyltransferase [Planctomycetota bacterium]